MTGHPGHPTKVPSGLRTTADVPSENWGFNSGANAIATPKRMGIPTATPASFPMRPVGNRPVGKMAATAASASKKTTLPQPLNQASAVRRAGRRPSTISLALPGSTEPVGMKPHAMRTSSHPIGSRGRRQTSRRPTVPNHAPSKATVRSAPVATQESPRNAITARSPATATARERAGRWVAITGAAWERIVPRTLRRPICRTGDLAGALPWTGVTAWGVDAVPYR